MSCQLGSEQDLLLRTLKTCWTLHCISFQIRIIFTSCNPLFNLVFACTGIRLMSSRLRWDLRISTYVCSMRMSIYIYICLYGLFSGAQKFETRPICSKLQGWVDMSLAQQVSSELGFAKIWKKSVQCISVYVYVYIYTIYLPILMQRSYPLSGEFPSSPTT